MVMGKFGGGALKIGIMCRWKEINEMTSSRTSWSQWPRGLRRGLRGLSCWDYGFESRRRHVSLSLSLVNVVCCHVEVSA